MNHSNDTRIIQKLYRSLLPVQAFAFGLTAINTLLNSFIVGNYFGEVALAAIGFTGPLTMFISAISGVIYSGSQILCGKYLGNGNKKNLNGVFSTVLLSCVFFGLLITLAFVLMPSALASAMGASGDVGKLTADYIRGLGIGTVFSMLTSCMLTFLQIEQMKKTSVVCTIITITVNIGGNFANALYLHWGLFGVSFFMSVSSIASCLAALTMIFTRGSVFRFSPGALNFGILRQIIVIGFPDVVYHCVSIVRSRVFNHLLFSLGGTTAMAAFSVAGSVSLAIGSFIGSGSNGAGKTVASVLVGHRDSFTFKNMTRIIAKTVFPLYLVAYIAVVIFAKPFALLLGAEEAHIDVFVTAILLYNFWYIVDCLITPVINMYAAIEKTRLISTGYAACILSTTLICYLLTKVFGANVIYCGLWINILVSILYYFVYYIIKTKHMPKSPFDMVYVPDSLRPQPEDCFNSTITDIDTAVDASRRLYDFCVSKGLPRRTAYVSSLCVEEIAVDAVKNRFKKKKSAMDLRVIFENGGLCIITRDDCPHFDPKEWLELCSPEDEARSIGIKMAMDMAKDTNYVSTLGLNVLMLHM